MKHLSVTIKTPYCTLNELTDTTETIWLVCHGQGQLVEYFIKKWEVLDPSKHFIIAPQGLSKYYLNGFSGRVGATWMTREDRLTEIENQQTLLGEIWKKEVPEVGKRRVILFGFSQGVATICRFAGFSKMPFDTLVLWAGTFPPDLPENPFSHLSGKERVFYFTAEDDPFYQPDRIPNQTKLVQENMGLEPEVQFYEGGHRIISELLLSI